MDDMAIAVLWRGISGSFTGLHQGLVGLELPAEIAAANGTASAGATNGSITPGISHSPVLVADLDAGPILAVGATAVVSRRRKRSRKIVQEEEEEHLDEEESTGDEDIEQSVPKRRNRGGRVACDFPCEPPCDSRSLSGGQCSRHGGGARCSVPDCTTGAVSGGKCIQHGGGLRCSFPDCTTSALSGGKCKRHGGGLRCSFPDCTTSAESGCNGKCKRHGKLAF